MIEWKTGRGWFVTPEIEIEEISVPEIDTEETSVAISAFSKTGWESLADVALFTISGVDYLILSRQANKGQNTNGCLQQVKFLLS